jgi:hypothetical protein
MYAVAFLAAPRPGRAVGLGVSAMNLHNQLSPWQS